jgi:hypothetical protein
MIKEAAIRKDGEVFTGKYHSDIISRARPFGYLRNGEQGFMTDDGKFVSREEAAKIAFECEQISESKDKLFSEDL